MPDLPTLLTIQQVAERLNVTAETVRRHVRSRRMGCYRLQGCIRISPEQVAEFLASCLSPAEPAAFVVEVVQQPRLESAVAAFRQDRRFKGALGSRPPKS